METLPLFPRLRVTAVVELNAKLVRVRDSMITFVTLKDPKTWWIREPLNPTMLTLYMPIGVVAFVEILIAPLAVPPAARNTIPGEVPNDTPGGTDGRIAPDIETLPVNPPMLVTVILMKPAEPGVSVKMLGLILIVKSGPIIGDMVRRRVAVCVRLPLVPVTWME